MADQEGGDEIGGLPMRQKGRKLLIYARNLKKHNQCSSRKFQIYRM